MEKAGDLGRRANRLFESTLNLDFRLFYSWRQWHEAKKKGMAAAIQDWIEMAELVQHELGVQNILANPISETEDDVNKTKAEGGCKAA